MESGAAIKHRKSGENSVVVDGYPRVVDGDTLVFEEEAGGKERVRLAGIDAPESNQMCVDKYGNEYDCGAKSKAYLESKIGQNSVSCHASKRDRYSRMLGTCYNDRTGEELNEAMVRNGEAVAYHQFSESYDDGEKRAKKGRQ
eukprot:3204836-Rhodomonas_salina.1